MHQTLRIPCLLGPFPPEILSVLTMDYQSRSPRQKQPNTQDWCEGNERQKQPNIQDGVTAHSGTVPGVGVGGYGGTVGGGADKAAGSVG